MLRRLSGNRGWLADSCHGVMSVTGTCVRRHSHPCDSMRVAGVEGEPVGTAHYNHVVHTISVCLPFIYLVGLGIVGLFYRHQRGWVDVSQPGESVDGDTARIAESPVSFSVLGLPRPRVLPVRRHHRRNRRVRPAGALALTSRVAQWEGARDSRSQACRYRAARWPRRNRDPSGFAYRRP